MGKLIDGVWFDNDAQAKASDGKFVRKDSHFRNWVTADGSAGPSGVGGFGAESGRYHLYVSLACPWAHRALIFRKLKGLEEMISVSYVDALMMENGWELADGADPINGARFLYQVYTAADPAYTGRVTVPVLWDKQQRTIVSNESAEIIRMFNSAFDDIGAKSGDFYPETLRGEIDAINDVIYRTVNNGVYRSGFATTQAAYEEAVTALFATLDELETRLGENRYLMGDVVTEADWRLFTTLLRFDPVYVGHFKCNIRRLRDYPNLSGYLRELYQVSGIRETVDIDYIKTHYYGSHRSVNPTGIVPVGPILELDAPHGRDHL
ncbi:MAG: glutathione S-transferase family protein [Rhodospirillaceae bacterium]|nr:glutathione S-transferase family protein [Rhodospirillaceae bacterium]